MSAEQTSLPLETIDENLLRLAYERNGDVRHKFTFAQAMEITAIRIGLRNEAEALLKRRGEGKDHV